MMGYDQPRILVLGQNMKRQSGRKVQLDNVKAAKAVADIIRTCLGPRAMLKMLLNPMGSIVLTNDGNAILREITVQHPAAKSMIEISRTQDEEVGDGTTSVIILAGEFMTVATPFLEQNIHPTIMIRGYREALNDMIKILKEEIAIPIDLNDEQKVLQVIQSCLNTKILGKNGEFACRLALDAVRCVKIEQNGRTEIDIKRFARVEKVPGGTFEDSKVLKGVMLNKDVVHAKMRRRIEKPRILLLDCNLEYKKGESQTDVELTKEGDFTELLKIEEEFIQQMCADIIKFKPDLVCTEKGCSDLAQHFLAKANISVLRRLKKTDNNRIARATGATIVNRTDEIRDEDIGLGCGLFEVVKIGDEHFSYITDCVNPKACTILLRGPSKDILGEIERNLQDAMSVARNLLTEPFVVPGGGATEMAIGKRLKDKVKTVATQIQGPYRAIPVALEVIPRTLIQNCGGDTIRKLVALRAKHASDPEGNKNYGINGETGEIFDVTTAGIWEPLVVKLQSYKTAIETAIILLRIDDIVSGSKKKDEMEKERANMKAQNMKPTEESEKD